MALFSPCTLFIFICFTAGSIRQSTANYAYGDERKESFPSLEFRSKRYVAEPIQRLADNYDKLFKNSDSREKNQVELIGSLAIEGLQEAKEHQPLVTENATQQPPSSTNQSLATVNETSTTMTPGPTPAPEKKPSKKPIDLGGKKHLEEDKAKPMINITHDAQDGIDELPKEISNTTLTKHNITDKQVEEDHRYYTSRYIGNEQMARHYWIDLEKEPGVTVHEMLSKSHRRAATVRLTFDFPFYGHKVRNMTVATGGFLYTGDYIHSWLAATQYIAPLMANFDTSMSDESFVKYRDNGTSFTVEWCRVTLHNDTKGTGEFTFQVTLYQNGDIVFVYKAIPMLVENINDTMHPVKVGLSDAYIIDKTVFYIRKKTIYEYHRFSLDKDDIKNWTAIYMKALPTCVGLRDCHSCLNHNTTFHCRWCDAVGRCSAGYDRHLQDWSQNHCPEYAISDSSLCGTKSSRQSPQSLAPHSQPRSKADEERQVGHSGMLGMFIVVCFVMCFAAWVYHAYRNPHTRFGQILIKYRPSQWRFGRRGEARYTAATIHM